MSVFTDNVCIYVVFGLITYVMMILLRRYINNCTRRNRRRSSSGQKRRTQHKDNPGNNLIAVPTSGPIPDPIANLNQLVAPQIAPPLEPDLYSLRTDYFESEPLAAEPFHDDEAAMQEDDMDDVYQDMIQRKFEFRDDDDDNDPDYVPTTRILCSSCLRKYRS